MLTRSPLYAQCLFAAQIGGPIAACEESRRLHPPAESTVKPNMVVKTITAESETMEYALNTKKKTAASFMKDRDNLGKAIDMCEGDTIEVATQKRIKGEDEEMAAAHTAGEAR